MSQPVLHVRQLLGPQGVGSRPPGTCWADRRHAHLQQAAAAPAGPGGRRRRRAASPACRRVVQPAHVDPGDRGAQAHQLGHLARRAGQQEDAFAASAPRRPGGPPPRPPSGWPPRSRAARCWRRPGTARGRRRWRCWPAGSGRAAAAAPQPTVTWPWISRSSMRARATGISGPPGARSPRAPCPPGAVTSSAKSPLSRQVRKPSSMARFTPLTTAVSARPSQASCERGGAAAAVVVDEDHRRRAALGRSQPGAHGLGDVLGRAAGVGHGLQPLMGPEDHARPRGPVPRRCGRG